MTARRGNVDLAEVRAAARRQAGRETAGIRDIAGYLDRAVTDRAHREVIGPLLPGTGASGTVTCSGRTIATWGDPAVAEMAFSVSKTLLSVVAGVAFDRGMLAHPVRNVLESVPVPAGPVPAIRTRRGGCRSGP
ncbi:hypothetical protein CFN78_22695 [Amycolatopsis antarctica]|uniref:Beta-lactamase-related domain-containing protein n=1 Tax=Amycolatopsis antarctica TaxID=1854586 RepID=A0A263CXU2_9PSEU|nr:hypothetical protein [Amycolatopsis antarctica]OZM70963.1 hypothetical protein CFN78_22695 [Amycolatopsis antarctica]